MTWNLRLFLLLLCGSLALDQGSKLWARRALAPREPPRVTVIDGWFELEYAENPGSAFGGFHDGKARWPLAGLAVIGLGVLLFALRRLDPDQRGQAAALGLIGGGALGNAVDRVLHGPVTDFILWRYGPHRWPNFNVADAALVLGVAAVVLAGLRRRSPRQRAGRLSSAAPR